MTCGPTDIACQVSQGIQQALWTIVAPILIAIVIFLVAIFILPKAGKKGWAAAILVIFGELWWFGLIPYLPPLHSLFGM